MCDVWDCVVICLAWPASPNVMYVPNFESSPEARIIHTCKRKNRKENSKFAIHQSPNWNFIHMWKSYASIHVCACCVLICHSCPSFFIHQPWSYPQSASSIEYHQKLFHSPWNFFHETNLKHNVMTSCRTHECCQIITSFTNDLRFTLRSNNCNFAVKRLPWF